MLTPELLERLRCPMAPSRSKLEEDEEAGALVCVSCRLVFPMREGIASLLVEEARLPEGCPSLQDLPCQQR
ncbi:MAG: hypothetical protein K2W96_20615 [Gemmataceae bacterium]|nr:hypothetical protein [Gemmataceae bacterium]